MSYEVSTYMYEHNILYPYNGYSYNQGHVLLCTKGLSVFKNAIIFRSYIK